MYSKRLFTATLLLCASCSFSLPWAHEPIGQEVNLSFVVRNNLLFLPSATIDGRAGQFLIGTSAARTALDGSFSASLPAASRGHSLQLGEKVAVPLTPVVMNLHNVADAIIGADAWDGRAISIDYASGLLTYQKEGIHPELMTIFPFTAEPRVAISVDGKRIGAIVDTASPDTLILPRGNAPAGRTHARITLAGADLGNLDIRMADVSDARVGNRILSKYLLTIDYGKLEVGLWRDPRTL
ncbi:MAG: hypothetical protein ACRD3J_23665 [Thermoanaerobaculia bacterium]